VCICSDPFSNTAHSPICINHHPHQRRPTPSAPRQPHYRYRHRPIPSGPRRHHLQCQRHQKLALPHEPSRRQPLNPPAHHARPRKPPSERQLKSPPLTPKPLRQRQENPRHTTTTSSGKQPTAGAIVVHALPTKFKIGDLRRWLQEDNEDLAITGARWLLSDVHARERPILPWSFTWPFARRPYDRGWEGSPTALPPRTGTDRC